MGTISVARTGRKRVRAVEAGAPTYERLDKAGGAVERGDHGTYTMRDAPLERALLRGLEGKGGITQAQYSAGQKFRHHWYHSGLSEGLSSIDLNRVFAADVSGFSGMPRTETQAFHRRHHREAVEEVGTDGAGLLYWVVCREGPLEDVGYTLGWKTQPQATAAATERLRMVLDQLRKLWGI